MPSKSQTYAVRLAVKDGGRVKAELKDVGQTGEKSFEKISSSSKKSTHNLKRFGGTVKKTQGHLMKLKGALGVLTAAGGLGMLAKRALNDADHLLKTSEKLGVTAKALQEYGYAAKCAGIDQSAFEMALQRFTRRTAEAAAGGGAAKEALETLGIELKTQGGHLRKTEDLLMEVARAFERVEDPAERVRLAFKLFDSGGVSMINMLGAGAQALDHMRKQAQDLGIVLEDDLLKNAAKSQTQLDTLGKVISAHLNRAMLDAAPLLSDMAQGLSKVAIAAGSAYQKLKYVFSDDFAFGARNIQEMEALIVKLQKRIESKPKNWLPNPFDLVGARNPDLIHLQKAERYLGRLKAQMAQESRKAQKTALSPQDLMALTPKTSHVSPKTTGDQKVLASMKQEMARLHLSEKEQFMASAQDRLSINATKEQREEVKKLAAALYEERVALDALKKVRQSQNELLKKGKSLMEQHQEPFKKYQEALDKSNKLLKAGAIDQRTYEAVQKEAYDQLLVASDTWSAGVIRGLNQVKQEAGDMASQFEHLTTQAFARSEDAFLKWAKTGKFAASDLFETIGDEMLRMAYRTAIVQPLSGAMGGIMQGIGSSLGGFFSVAHKGGILGEDRFSQRHAPLATFKDAPRYHSGGMVGEMPIIAQRGEAVFTKGQLKALGAGLQSQPLQIKVNVENKAAQTKVQAHARQDSGNGLRLDLILEHVEANLVRHVHEGQGLAPTLERRYGLNPAAGIYR